MIKNNLKLHKAVDSLPWPIAKRLREFLPAPTGYYFIVKNSPLIIIIPEDFYDEEKRWTPFFDSLKSHKVYFFCKIRCAIEANPKAYKELIAKAISKHSHRYPNHHFIFMANNLAQTRIFNELGMESIFANHNCLVDETSFSINIKAPKHYDAIYNAVSAPYKRHELARFINKLAIITYLQPQHLNYFYNTTRLLSHAKWLNFPEDNFDTESYQKMSPAKISKSLNQSKVGLCLSNAEGAMVSSIEYLLAGLPIVSTYSLGGRDVFFDDSYVNIVEDNPEAVKEGVERMILKNPDPYKIRTTTLEKLKAHRLRFAKAICKISAHEGIETDTHIFYSQIFPQNIFKLRPFHKILELNTALET